MLALPCDTLADDYHIAVPKAPINLAGIEADDPDIILIGTAVRDRARA